MKNKQIQEMKNAPTVYLPKKIEKDDMDCDTGLTQLKQQTDCSLATITEQDEESKLELEKADEEVDHGMLSNEDKCSTGTQSIQSKRRKLIVTIDTSIEPTTSSKDDVESVVENVDGHLVASESRYRDYLHANNEATVEPQSCSQ